jgi:hypothetical protein
MKIQLYISLLAVLAVGLFVVNATFAEDQTPNCPNCLQCFAPGVTWSAPATAATTAPAREVKRVDSPWNVLGSILATPFVIGQCIFEGCP